jgi:hypothetical protein
MVVGNNLQETEKNELRNEIIELEHNILDLKLKIDKINRIIMRECIEKHGGHDYQRERDDGLYGESYFVCKICKYEYY